MEGQVEISDIGLAAFLKVVKGLKYADIPKRKPGEKRFSFVFKISQRQFKAYQSEYINSTYRIFDQEVKSLKKIIHG